MEENSKQCLMEANKALNVKARKASGWGCFNSGGNFIQKLPNKVLNFFSTLHKKNK